MSFQLFQLEKYIADYEDAPSWGGPTQYPSPPPIKDMKAIAGELRLLEEIRDLMNEVVPSFGVDRNVVTVNCEDNVSAVKFYAAIYKVRNRVYPKIVDELP